MATLGNILARKGGTAMTGLEVTLTLAIPQAGAPLVEEAKVLLLPVSETRKARAFREAEAYVTAQEEAAREAGTVCPAPTAVDERAFRFLVEAMRDPEDARKYFVEAKHIGDFRNILIAEQKRYLIESYDELIKREYAELRADEVKEQAKQVFPSGQPSP